MRTGALSTMVAVALFLVVAAPLAAGDQPTGREEAKAGDAEQGAEDAEYYKPRPKTYRERINLIARKPLEKEDRKVVRESQPPGRRGVRVAISRKRTQEPKARKSRFDHVKEVARGPIRQPVRSED